MAIDDWSGSRDDQDDPIENAFAITPHDVNELPRITRALFVGSAGNLTVRFVGDSSDVVLVGVAAGSLLPFRLSHVRATGTTASTGLVGLR